MAISRSPLDYWEKEEGDITVSQREDVESNTRLEIVAQAVPVYCMGALLIPPTLADKLERMLNSFWWGLNR